MLTDYGSRMFLLKLLIRLNILLIDDGVASRLVALKGFRDFRVLPHGNLYDTLYEVIAGRQLHEVASDKVAAHASAYLYDIDLVSIDLQLNMGGAVSELQGIERVLGYFLYTRYHLF